MKRGRYFNSLKCIYETDPWLYNKITQEKEIPIELPLNKSSYMLHASYKRSTIEFIKKLMKFPRVVVRYNDGWYAECNCTIFYLKDDRIFIDVKDYHKIKPNSKLLERMSFIKSCNLIQIIL